MHKILFSFVLMLMGFNLNAQDNNIVNDSMIFLVRPKEYLGYYKSLNDLNSKKNSIHLEDSNTILILGLADFNTYFGIDFKDEETAYISKQDAVFYDKERQNYIDSNTGDLETRKNFALGVIRLQKNKEKALDQYNPYEIYKGKGLIIIEKEYSYEDYSDAFGLKLGFYNGYKKDIKYIDLTVRSYNRVGDPINDYFFKNVVRPQIIGPIKRDTASTVEFSDLFYDKNDVISYLVITYMKITFMDGSVKEIKDVNNYLAEDVYNGKG